MGDDYLSHLDERGNPRMVNVGEKEITRRIAVAEGRIRTSPETVKAVADGKTKKGNVLLVAQLAGITGAKRTADLIPLCHPLPLSAIEVDLELDESLPGIRARARVQVEARTGVEMEALTAVSCALLTVYDMCKAIDKGMVMDEIRLVRKEGGRGGDWSLEREEA